MIKNHESELPSPSYAGRYRFPRPVIIIGRSVRLRDGHCTHRKTVAHIMKTHGWRAKAARKYKATTNSNHTLPVAPNLLHQNFEADRPDQKWVSDITYIWTDEGWLYLAVVLDLYA